MIIKLTDGEVRDALKKAMAQKIDHIFQVEEDVICWFDVRAGGKDIEDLEAVEFSVDFG